MGMYTVLDLDVTVLELPGFNYLKELSNNKLDVKIVNGQSEITITYHPDFNEEDELKINKLSDNFKTFLLDYRHEMVVNGLHVTKIGDGFRLSSTEHLKYEGIKNYTDTYGKLLKYLEDCKVVTGYMKTQYEEWEEWTTVATWN